MIKLRGKLAMRSDFCTAGELLRQHRLQQGMPIEELEHRAQLGPGTVGRIELGKTKCPRRETRQLLYKALHLKAAERSELDLAWRRASMAPEPCLDVERLALGLDDIIKLAETLKGGSQGPTGTVIDTSPISRLKVGFDTVEPGRIRANASHREFNVIVC